jgi:oligopeptide/dipeptide ABC transporter ATP-binding protein
MWSRSARPNRSSRPPYHPYTEALLSAVPIADTKVKKQHIVLEGDIPSAMNPPPGCPFQTRCRWKKGRAGLESLRDARCRRCVTLDEGHQVAGNAIVLGVGVAVAPRRVIDATIARALPGAHRIAFERLDAAGPALHGRLRAKPGEAPWVAGPAVQRALPTASAAGNAFFADYANALVAASRALIAEL